MFDILIKINYQQLNLNHTVPNIVDGELSLWKSRDIIEYLSNQYASDTSPYPSDPRREQ